MAKKPKEPKPLKLSDMSPEDFMNMIIVATLITNQTEGTKIDNIDAIKIAGFQQEAERVVSIYLSLEED